MKHLKRFNESETEFENTDNTPLRKFVVTTTSESSDHYIYLIEHATEPTSEELERFLKENGNDFDEERTYESVDEIMEITGFERIPS